jgi:thiol:disulfide interchange protein DsbD
MAARSALSRLLLATVVGCAASSSPWRMPTSGAAAPSSTAPSATATPIERGELPDAELRQASVEGPWHQDETVALDSARQQRRPILVDVTAEWCVPCKLLEADTLDDPVVRAYLVEYFVGLRIDVTEESRSNREQQRRYRVRGLPTLLLLDWRGVELDRIESYLDPRALLTRMESARARSAE